MDDDYPTTLPFGRVPGEARLGLGILIIYANSRYSGSKKKVNSRTSDIWRELLGVILQFLGCLTE